jgi:hypothetical protein
VADTADTPMISRRGWINQSARHYALAAMAHEKHAPAEQVANEIRLAELALAISEKAPH